MSAESYLLQVFLLSHLGISASFLFIGTLLSRWRKTHLNPVAAYRSYFLAFLAATVMPVVAVIWQSGFIDSLQDTVSINSTLATATPMPQISIDASDMAPNLDQTINPTAGFTLVSNSSNRLQVWDQLSYVLSPILQLTAVLIAVGLMIRWMRILMMLYSTRALVWRSHTAKVPAMSRVDITIPILISDEITVPMAVGLIKPVILIPQVFQQKLDEQQLRHILLHERAHHQRGDLWVTLLTTILASLYWWNPLLKLMNRKIRLYREIVCDQIAAKESNDKLGYAQALLDCAKLMLKPRRALLVQEFVGTDNELKSRLTQLLDGKGFDRTTIVAPFLPLLFLIAVGIVASNSLAELVQSESQQRVFRQYRLLDADAGNSLLTAIDRKDLSSIDQLLQSDTLRDTPIAFEGTALMVAIKKGNSELVQLMLSRGADPDQGASRRGNPLILAAGLGELDIVEMLISFGADVNAIVPRDETPLMSATRHNQLEAAKLLIRHGARIDLGVRTATSDGLVYRTPHSLASGVEMQQLLSEN